MGETFLISINCSRILGDHEETQYTMFIDSTKMSIVHELVECIRWMFSLENCFYITHDNSVIHELEDIQLLSRLKNLEVKPCGRVYCVHKKIYRTLFKNLNLFVSWNGIKVPKYFLHKLNQVDQKLSQANSKTKPVIYASGNAGQEDFMSDKNTNTDYSKNISHESNNLLICENKVPKENTPLIKTTLTAKSKCGVNDEFPTEPNSSLHKKILNENLVTSEHQLNYLDDFNSGSTENLMLETSKPTLINETPVNTVKQTLKTKQEHNKNSQKSYPKKYVKPFSLGEILSNIRDFERQNTEMTHKENWPSPNPVMMEEGNFDENITSGKNSFTNESKISEGRKRQRIRKRKKSKKENLEKGEITSPYLDTNFAASSLDITNKVKPNHIRFAIENDNLMETECAEDEQNMQNENKFEHVGKQMNDAIETESSADEQNTQLKNKFETVRKQINDSAPLVFSKINAEEFVTVNMDSNQDLSKLYQACSATSNTENKMEYSFEVDSSTAQPINLKNSAPDNTNQPSGCIENFELNRSKPELNTLLSLKEKFKNAVVFERFY